VSGQRPLGALGSRISAGDVRDGPLCVEHAGDFVRSSIFSGLAVRSFVIVVERVGVEAPSEKVFR
jgi:hypothetical protein